MSGVQLVSLLLLAVSLTSRAAAQKPRKSSKPDASAEFFARTNIPRLRIEINATNLAALKKDNRKYVRSIVRDGETVYSDIGVHLKGAAGSFRALEDRPALTLNFDKFVEDQKFHGLDKLHLNNSVQDPSYMTEILCGEMFRAAGVPTPRGTHARVELNGRDVGLYVLKEGFDKTFLKRHFKNSKGNLYDSGLLKDVTDNLEKDSGEGDVADHADLKGLVAAAQEADTAKRFEKLEKMLDLDKFLSFVAMEVMTWHWDGYSLNRNNYRVYHDPDANKIIFLPHGMDQMFWEPNGPIQPAMQGLVSQALLKTTEGRKRYRQRVGELFTNVFKVAQLTNRVNELQAKIRPALAAISPNAAKEHDGQANRLRDLIVQRAASIERQLSAPEPTPLKFDAAGSAALSGWTQNDTGNATLDQPTESGKPTLHIRANGTTSASWRAKVLLESGQYRFVGKVKTAGVASVKDQKGEGAGLRISGSQQARANFATGESDWKKLEYEFSVAAGQDEVLLVAELRASKGDAWFDAQSLKLVRVGR